MTTRFLGAIATLCLCASTATAQRPLSLDRVPEFRGNASGGPPDCLSSHNDALAAIRTWFRALSTGDTTLIEKAIAPGFHWVTDGMPFTPPDSQFAGRDFPSLARYVSARGKMHESTELQEITFNGWQGRELQMGPIWYLRTADDLGPKPLSGSGKAVYLCGKGLMVMSFGGRIPQAGS